MPFKHDHALQRHFIRHGEEFQAGTADEYERLADEFLAGPLQVGAMECYRTSGDLVRFDPTTNEFGVLSKNGYVSTYLIHRSLPGGPTGLQYFQYECGR